MKWIVAWTAKTDGRQPPPNFEQEVRSEEELDRRLDQLDAEGRAKDPVMVDLYDEENTELPSLSIGVGSDRSVVCWTVPDGEPGSMLSYSGVDADSELSFVSAGEPTFFSARHLVSIGQAREAMRVFMRTQRRPDNLEWDEV